MREVRGVEGIHGSRIDFDSSVTSHQSVEKEDADFWNLKETCYANGVKEVVEAVVSHES
jgi:hypothetical protein